ncbi:hypothetical protein ACIPO9_00220 [Pseudomonas sp. NPDC090203]|uniref:hypothetical protein n=1 Tax=unclassified Pseudomonas TaxID=196821 RepID=UPI00382FA5AC
MKRQILLSIALSVLAANVFAADGAEHLKQYQGAQISAPVTQEQVAADGADHLKAFQTASVTFDAKNAETVAEVRSEFGSQFQRY